MHAIRVDGNDMAAVYAATKAARELAIANSCPVLIEATSENLEWLFTALRQDRQGFLEAQKSEILVPALS